MHTGLVSSVSLSSLLNQDAGKSKGREEILLAAALCEADCFQQHKILWKCCDMASVLEIQVMQPALR